MPILYHEDIIKVFAKKVRNIITIMVNLRKENIELTKQRDELLPLLMNGQATVNYHLYFYLQLIIYCIFPHVVKINSYNKRTTKATLFSYIVVMKMLLLLSYCTLSFSCPYVLVL